MDSLSVNNINDKLIHNTNKNRVNDIKNNTTTYYSQTNNNINNNTNSNTNFNNINLNRSLNINKHNFIYQNLNSPQLIATKLNTNKIMFSDNLRKLNIKSEKLSKDKTRKKNNNKRENLLTENIIKKNNTNKFNYLFYN